MTFHNMIQINLKDPLPSRDEKGEAIKEDKHFVYDKIEIVRYLYLCPNFHPSSPRILFHPHPSVFCFIKTSLSSDNSNSSKHAVQHLSKEKKRNFKKYFFCSFSQQNSPEVLSMPTVSNFLSVLSFFHHCSKDFTFKFLSFSPPLFIWCRYRIAPL